MKVWVLITDYEVCRGVFSTREKVIQYLAQHDMSEELDDGIDIIEYTLDIGEGL